MRIAVFRRGWPRPWLVGLALVLCLSGLCLNGGMAGAAPTHSTPAAPSGTDAGHGSRHGAPADAAGCHDQAAAAGAIGSIVEPCAAEACCDLTASVESRAQAPAWSPSTTALLPADARANAASPATRLQVRPPGDSPGSAPTPLTC